ncbi:Securin-2 [Camelus dromedarius]|uniref:Securin-2 n=1 Tax=Camelus dromedarius TaxID=9838 RepID=A0A5N4C3F4_CAMDR|nr:Securin-2 [Camelus dromedarius]
MATLIFVDKENEEPGIRVAPMDQLQLGFGPSDDQEDCESSVPASDDSYPETETFFPFDLLDFELFNLPEEDQIAQLPLNGVPLMILDEEGHLEQL